MDLVAKLLSAVPASVLGGLKGTATVTVTESGTSAAAGSVTIEVQFATDAAGADATTVKTLAERVNLKQGKSRSYKVPFNYPTGLASGSYFLLATVANGTGLAADLDVANNTAASGTAVAIAPAFVALTGSGLSVGTVASGGSAVAALDVTNGGNVTAHGTTSVVLYLSSDGTLADATLLDTVPLVVGLAAGKSHPSKLKFTVPTSAVAGTYTLLAVVDPAHSLGTTDDSTGVAVTDATAVVLG